MINISKYAEENIAEGLKLHDKPPKIISCKNLPGNSLNFKD
jgi:hypothetical protein